MTWYTVVKVRTCLAESVHFTITLQVIQRIVGIVLNLHIGTVLIWDVRRVSTVIMLVRCPRQVVAGTITHIRETGERQCKTNCKQWHPIK